MAHLDTAVTCTEADLMKSSAITRQHVATGMTIRDLCDAAVRFSDGTSGNLLLRDLGGPAELTAYEEPGTGRRRSLAREGSYD
jgi:beta-lactamase class A